MKAKLLCLLFTGALAALLAILIVRGSSPAVVGRYYWVDRPAQFLELKSDGSYLICDTTVAGDPITGRYSVRGAEVTLRIPPRLEAPGLTLVLHRRGSRLVNDAGL